MNFLAVCLQYVLFSSLSFAKQYESEYNKQSSSVSLYKASQPTKFLLSLRSPRMTINWSLFCGKFHSLSSFFSCFICPYLRFYRLLRLSSELSWKKLPLGLSWLGKEDTANTLNLLKLLITQSSVAMLPLVLIMRIRWTLTWSSFSLS